jgi:hypothetical protein
MARSILISLDEKNELEGVSFGYNTLIFEVIIEGTRAEFKTIDMPCAEICFSDLDDKCMEYISLCDLTPQCFKIFVCACEQGLHKLIISGDVVIDYLATPAEISCIASLWGNLVAALKNDPRWN